MEVDFVAIDEALPQALWTRNIIQAQGYSIQEIIIHPDNLRVIMFTLKGVSNSSRKKDIQTSDFLYPRLKATKSQYSTRYQKISQWNTCQTLTR